MKKKRKEWVGSVVCAFLVLAICQPAFASEGKKEIVLRSLKDFGGRVVKYCTENPGKISGAFIGSGALFWGGRACGKKKGYNQGWSKGLQDSQYEVLNRFRREMIEHARQKSAPDYTTSENSEGPLHLSSPLNGAGYTGGRASTDPPVFIDQNAMQKSASSPTTSEGSDGRLNSSEITPIPYSVVENGDSFSSETSEPNEEERVPVHCTSENSGNCVEPRQLADAIYNMGWKGAHNNFVGQVVMLPGTNFQVRQDELQAKKVGEIVNEVFFAGKEIGKREGIKVARQERSDVTAALIQILEKDELPDDWQELARLATAKLGFLTVVKKWFGYEKEFSAQELRDPNSLLEKMTKGFAKKGEKEKLTQSMILLKNQVEKKEASRQALLKQQDYFIQEKNEAKKEAKSLRAKIAEYAKRFNLFSKVEQKDENSESMEVNEGSKKGGSDEAKEEEK